MSPNNFAACLSLNNGSKYVLLLVFSVDCCCIVGILFYEFHLPMENATPVTAWPHLLRLGLDLSPQSIRGMALSLTFSLRGASAGPSASARGFLIDGFESRLTLWITPSWFAGVIAERAARFSRTE